MINLKEHYSSSAERFLQTAIVIDDQAVMGAGQMLIPAGPVVAPPSGLLEAADAPTPQVVGVAIEQQSETPANSLNAKVLTEAFLARKMICGLYRPSPGENMVERTTGAAEAADVVVVDWHLEPGNSRPAKDIILGLLRADKAEKGRLRLIAVYTSQAGREAIASELLEEVEQTAELQGLLQRDGAVLRNSNTRLVVLNKRYTPEAADREEVTEEGLPGRLVSEFAELCKGVLPSFALSSVAAIRRGAHHVLALYTSDLDGAFIAHRCGIPHPDDAKNFALDLITSELRNLIEVNDVTETTLGSPIIEAWVESKLAGGHRFRSENAEIPDDHVKGFVDGGSRSVEKSGKAQHAHGAPDTKVDEENRITCGTLARTFYSNADDARNGVRRLSRLSTFQREADRTRLPEGWLPLLTLGSLIQTVTEAGGGELLLCVQPRCDSIRLKARTAFPFQTISGEAPTFNLIVRDLASTDRETWVNLKPRDARMIEFEPDGARQAVLAARDTGAGRYLFRDADGQSYAWLGDLKEMKAQRWAGELGSRVQVVGLEELEWLRWASERKLKRNWA